MTKSGSNAAKQLDEDDFYENISAVMSKFDKQTLDHLKKVYGSIAAAALFAALGSSIHCFGYIEGGWLSIFGSVGTIFMLAFSRNRNGEENGTRFLYLIIFALSTGMSTGPLLQNAWNIEPSIVLSALMYTCVIFTTFSLWALLAPEGKYLMFGAPLISILFALVVTSILNIFIQSQNVAYMQLLVGLLLMSTFILYDTQLIIKKFRHGDKDYIWHALILFIDLASVFKHMLMFLADKQSKRSKRDRKCEQSLINSFSSVNC